jgi:hypothetical protein
MCGPTECAVAEHEHLASTQRPEQAARITGAHRRAAVAMAGARGVGAHQHEPPPRKLARKRRQEGVVTRITGTEIASEQHTAH